MKSEKRGQHPTTPRPRILITIPSIPGALRHAAAPRILQHMGTALAFAPEHAASPAQGRIRPALREAVRLMVEDALTRSQAAEKAGITDHALYCALRKAHVAGYRNELMEVLRTSEASRTIGRAAKLADNAESEHVRLQANTWLAGIEGIAPAQRIENTHIHRNTAPGLVINFINAPGQASTARVIDEQAREVGSLKPINGLPVPVPHPSAGNARK